MQAVSGAALRSKYRLLALVLIMAASAAGTQVVAPPGPFEGFKSAGKEPVEIHSDSMRAELASGRLQFEGHVKAKQGDRVIYADRMEVRYTEDGKVVSLTAAGNVKVTMEGAFAAAGVLHLDNVARVIVLTEAPRLVQNKQKIVGEKMTYMIAEEKLVVDKPMIEWVPTASEGDKQKQTGGGREQKAEERQ